MIICFVQVLRKFIQYIKDIINEVSKLFPSHYIHLGGDEALVDKNWAVCSRCRALMVKLGYEKSIAAYDSFL